MVEMNAQSERGTKDAGLTTGEDVELAERMTG